MNATGKITYTAVKVKRAVYLERFSNYHLIDIHKLLTTYVKNLHQKKWNLFVLLRLCLLPSSANFIGR